ncbi:hypothetical protein R3P38DRAFT_3434256 [Favolaschia claudopus]|uniref:Uncharacterized protein n=1 Tax=Favolaschia claudopus TaxID=2862362 RepID=A0AAW0D1R3_9AGAR
MRTVVTHRRRHRPLSLSGFPFFPTRARAPTHPPTPPQPAPRPSCAGGVGSRDALHVLVLLLRLSLLLLPARPLPPLRRCFSQRVVILMLSPRLPHPPPLASEPVMPPPAHTTITSGAGAATSSHTTPACSLQEMESVHTIQVANSGSGHETGFCYTDRCIVLSRRQLSQNATIFLQFRPDPSKRRTKEEIKKMRHNLIITKEDHPPI